jgi:hypothetical protein
MGAETSVIINQMTRLLGREDIVSQTLETSFARSRMELSPS